MAEGPHRQRGNKDIPLYKFYLFFRRILIFMKHLQVCLFSLTFDIWKILLVGCTKSICFEVPEGEGGTLVNRVSIEFRPVVLNLPNAVTL